MTDIRMTSAAVPTMAGMMPPAVKPSRGGCVTNSHVTCFAP
jgi:hypothetical protein